MATGFNKWLLILLIPAWLYTGESIYGGHASFSFRGSGQWHPLHVSVTEINHNAADKTLEISCKLFTDDFERVLAKNYKTKVDLINPPDRPAMEKLVNDFIQKHLSIKTDGKPVQLAYLGFEKDNDAVYTYLQVENTGTVKKIEITNTILHELFTDEINLMHVMVGGTRKSIKLDYPETKAVINF
jgi:light-regulated signal transduction histidine kinase (bacteriophytochrome)